MTSDYSPHTWVANQYGITGEEYLRIQDQKQGGQISAAESDAILRELKRAEEANPGLSVPKQPNSPKEAASPVWILLAALGILSGLIYLNGTFNWPPVDGAEFTEGATLFAKASDELNPVDPGGWSGAGEQSFESAIAELQRYIAAVAATDQEMSNILADQVAEVIAAGGALLAAASFVFSMIAYALTLWYTASPGISLSFQMKLAAAVLSFALVVVSGLIGAGAYNATRMRDQKSVYNNMAAKAELLLGGAASTLSGVSDIPRVTPSAPQLTSLPTSLWNTQPPPKTSHTAIDNYSADAGEPRRPPAEFSPIWTPAGQSPQPITAARQGKPARPAKVTTQATNLDDADQAAAPDTDQIPTEVPATDTNPQPSAKASAS